MGKGLLYFCCSCCILVLTAINLSIGPVINGVVRVTGTENCAKISDDYDDEKEDRPNMSDEEKKYEWEWDIKRCKRKKGMHDMEYTSFIFDIVIGFVCGLIGLLHLFDLKKDFVSNTGLIGLGCGIVGFVLTFVYVIFNGLVYTNYYDNEIYKRNGDGAFAELDGNRYKCLYHDTKGNGNAILAKYSDLGKKQYNYNKDLIDFYTSTTSNEYASCTRNPDDCIDEEYITFTNPDVQIPKYDGNNKCNYLYVSISNDYYYNQVINKDKSDRFLTALILSLFVCLANIGLALFGFLLFRNPSDF